VEDLAQQLRIDVDSPHHPGTIMSALRRQDYSRRTGLSTKAPATRTMSTRPGNVNAAGTKNWFQGRLRLRLNTVQPLTKPRRPTPIPPFQPRAPVALLLAPEAGAAARVVPALKDRKGRALPPDVNRMMAEMSRDRGTKE
jgi:hypothetical protein